MLIKIKLVSGITPSSQPSLQPSSQPIVRPNKQPTMQPSKQPNAKPTKQPSKRPRAQPSKQPLKRPSKQPSKHPISQPTIQPTKLPSVQPTIEPSKHPISQPTTLPAKVPSQTVLAPSISPSYSLKDNYLHELDRLLQRSSSDQSIVELQYFDMYLSSHHVFGGCQSWLSFINNDLGLSEYNYEPQLINFTVVGPPRAISPAAISVRSTICDEVTAMHTILDLITSYTSGSVVCSGKRWVIKICAGSALSLCIDCADPCQLNNTQSFFMSPCQAQFPNGIQMLSVSYRTILLPPSIQTLEATPSNSSVKIVASLSSGGILNCGVFSPSKATSTISSYAVLKQNYNSATDRNNVSTIIIVGLVPSSSYALYCYTFYAGLTSSTEDMIANRRVVNTTCCKSIGIGRLASVIISSGSDIAKFFSIQSDGLPSTSMSIVLSLNATTSAIYPSRISWTSNDNPIAAASLRSLPEGVYFYAASVVGPSAHEFALSYTAGCRFRVIGPGQSLPSPSVTSAIFSSDGSHLIVSFDSPTNRGNISGSSCALPNDNFSIRSNATITARCPPASNCTTWPKATPAVVTVRRPLVPIKPNVVISAPFMIGSCDNLTIDLTLSYGNGGRSWTAVRIRVLDNLNSNLSALQHFLNTKYDISPPTMIPFTLITKGRSYTFTVTLCNFLSVCSSSSISVVASDTPRPVLTIVGGPVRQMIRSSLLSLSTATTIVNCGKQRSSYALSFQWMLYKIGVPVLSIDSVSKDLSKYILHPNSLDVGGLYTVKVSAAIRGTSRSSTYSVNIVVNIGAIHAVIAGGVIRFLPMDSSMTIDASNSYDDDQSGLFGAGLRFHWSCQQLSPHFNATCGGIFVISATNKSVISISSRPKVLTGTGQLLLVITDSEGSRATQATMSVSVLQPIAPVIVSLQSNVNGTKMNSGQSLQLTAVVKVAAVKNGSAVATWAVSDSSIVLPAIALTPVKMTIFQGITTVYLVIPPYKVVGGSNLIFSLSCKTSNLVETVTSISIVVNSPPRSGYLQVQPGSGVELQTKFNFLNFLWTDEDLPLEYQMGYISLTNLRIVLQPKSESPSTVSQLPADVDSSGMLQCFSDVYDALNANATSQFATKVSRGAIFSLDFQAALIHSTNRSSMSLDEIRRNNALSSYVLNFINCSAAPNCSALQRQPCSQTSNTCGSCENANVIGQSGDSNTLCFRRTSSTRRQPCLSTQQCFPQQECVLGVCQFPMQACPSNCSGHGSCTFVDVSSGLQLADCRIENDNCAAQCNCNANFQGSDSCSLNSTEAAARRALRAQLIDDVFYQITLEYPTEQAASSWIASIAAVSQIPSELDNSSATQVLTSNNFILSQASNLQMSPDELAGVLPSVNAVASAPVKGTSTPLLKTLQHFSSSIASTTVPGQTALSTVFPNFIMAIYNLPSVREDQLHLSLPQGRSDVPPSSIFVPNSNKNKINPEDCKVAMFALSSKVYGDGRMFLSNPLSFTYSNLPCESSSCSIQINLQNSLKPSSPSLYSNESVTIPCRKGLHHVSNYTCNRGHVLNTTCDGTMAGTVVHRCPSYHSSALCSSLNPVGVADVRSQCHLVNITAGVTVCSCHVGIKDHASARNRTAGRLLQDALSSSSNSTAGSLSVTAVINTIADSATSTVLSAQDLNAETVAKEWTVIATLGTFVAITLGLMLWVHYLDWKERPVSSRGFQSAGDKELALIEDSLPSVLSYRTFMERFLAEIRRHHRWLEVLFNFSASFPRSLRVLSLAVQVISMLFVQSVIYNVTNPDDGSCSTYRSRSECQLPKSSFGTASNKCQWNMADRSCSFIEPSEDITIVIFVAILSAALSTPIAVAEGIIIQNYLAAATSSKQDDSDELSATTKSFFFVMKDEGTERFIIDAKLNLVQMIAAQKRYREQLTADQRKEFDEQWGLSETVGVSTKKRNRLILWSRVTNRGSDVSRAILVELERVLKCEESERCWAESAQIGEKEKSRRLLHLFQRDLLPGLSGDILAAKSARDAVATRRSVSVRTKIFFYVLIAVANALMLFYVLLFAIQQTKHRQRAWFESFMLWFMTEILLTCTMVVWILHYLIPTIIVGDVRKVEQKMLSILFSSTARADSGTTTSSTDETEFNAAEYLFVSRRIAKRLPNNPIAKLILSFKTPWPRNSFKRVEVDDSSSSVCRSGISYALGNFLGMFAYGLGGFLQLPQGIQDGAVHTASALASGYVVLFHEQLFSFYPALAFVPLFCFCIYIHSLLNNRRGKAEPYPVRVLRNDESVEEDKGSVPDNGMDWSLSSATRNECKSGAAAYRRASLIQGMALIEDARVTLCVHNSGDSQSSCYDSPEESASNSVNRSCYDSVVEDGSQKELFCGSGPSHEFISQDDIGFSAQNSVDSDGSSYDSIVEDGSQEANSSELISLDDITFSDVLHYSGDDSSLESVFSSGI
eukprot:gene24404-32851_t